MHENQHNLVKDVKVPQNFDASPAVTTGMPQDPYFGTFRVEAARSAAWDASPLNLDSMGPGSTIKTRNEPTQYIIIKQT